jgi:hypothetical protein
MQAIVRRAVQCLLVAASALCASGCDVQQCKRGAVGCVDGPVRPDGTCAADLVAQGSRCVRRQDQLTGDAALIPDTCDPCPDGEICATDVRQCRDFCANAPSPDDGEAPPGQVVCGREGGGEPLSFDETCKNKCLLDCRRGAWFCGEPCNPKDCVSQAVLTSCHTACDSATDPLSCLQAACTDSLAEGCVEGSTRTCPSGKSPTCDGVLCANTCVGSVFDGVCDDGDPASAVSADCVYGTDCADCGPRPEENLDKVTNLTEGDACSFHAQCSGFRPSFEESHALCAPVTAGSSTKRCLRDCSSAGERCPIRTVCTPLTQGDGDTPLRDSAGIVAKVCVPSCE